MIADGAHLPGHRRRPGTQARAGRCRRHPGRHDQLESPVLDPRYTFDTFVIASSNRFAHAAAQSVAESPARSYNPLFIYGDAGLGKTHLLHAIGNYVLENFSGRHVRYVTTETYMNEFVDAIRTNATTAFKRRYRECDVLLIDDVQFMERKESLQEEFFHTFNSLYGASKQIVLTSDRPPKSIATLEDRLRSRFLSGLITIVQPPDLETRLAILQAKAEHEQVDVPDDVLDFIATHVKDNIRELEGALIRVTAFASLNRQPMSRELAEQVLSDIVSADQPRRITPQVILRRHVGDVRVLGRGTLRPQPPSAPGHRPPGQHVRLPRAHRLQLSGHRPGVRRPGPLHRDARRGQDRRPDEGAPSDLQPGHRSHRPHQEWFLTDGGRSHRLLRPTGAPPFLLSRGCALSVEISCSDWGNSVNPDELVHNPTPGHTPGPAGHRKRGTDGG